MTKLTKGKKTIRPDMDEIDPSVLTMPVQGRAIVGERRDFESQLSPNGDLILFLRHLGCSFCREMTAAAKDAASRRPDFPRVLFVHQGDVAQGDAYFERFWPEARAISDPGRKLYAAFKVGRGSLRELASPSVLVRAASAVANGHFPGVVIGDPLTMPGAFFVKNRKVLWQHRFKTVADLPHFLETPELFS